MKIRFIYLLLVVSLSLSSQTISMYKDMNLTRFPVNRNVIVSSANIGLLKCLPALVIKGTSSLSSSVCSRISVLFSNSREVDSIPSCTEFKVQATSYVKSNEDLSLAKRKGDVLYGILDQYTGEEITLSKVIGIPTIDNVIYFQLGTEYFKRNYDVIDSRWFGFVPDLVLDSNNAYVSGTDNSDKLSQLLKYTGTLKISKGNYFFNSSGFKIISNTTLDIGGSILKYKSTRIYSPFLTLGGERFLSENINLLNGTIIGNKNELETKTEWIHGICIKESKNVKIENMESNLNKGDGLYIGMDNEKEENRNKFIEVVNCIFDKNHRQGCSIVSGQNITFSNVKFNNTSGTAPQSGIDIEPNPHISGFRDLCKNIIFNNCEFRGNASTGARVNGVLNKNTNTDDISNIEFNNSTFSKNLSAGIEFRACKNIKVENCIVNALENGILFSDAVYKDIVISNTKVSGNKKGVGIYIIANSVPSISEDVTIDHCEVYNFGLYGVLIEKKASVFLRGFVFSNNNIHNNYHNVHIQKGVINAVYSGNISTKVGLDIDNSKYPGWTFGWKFSKEDDKATRKDYDVNSDKKED